MHVSGTNVLKKHTLATTILQKGTLSLVQYLPKRVLLHPAIYWLMREPSPTWMIPMYQSYRRLSTEAYCQSEDDTDGT